jgi:starch synthase (maltosyl-transferring)
VAGGRYPVKRVVGEPVVVEATVFAEGHERLHCVVAHQLPGARGWTLVPMAVTNAGLDRWQATFVPEAVGRHRYRVLAWVDHVGSWADATRRKVDAGVDVTSELLAGAALLDDAAATAPKADRAALADLAERLRAGDVAPLYERPADAGAPAAAPSRLEAQARAALRAASAEASKPTLEADVEPERALFNAWYELFPRSWSTEGPGRHGTLADVAAQLDYVASMGFDIVYLPPVHPIGTSFRKGPDNAETAGPGDPGSPWAIGSPDGGHTAVHPELGTVDDVAALVVAAADHGLDLALDLAFQCSPDHPWVSEHPEWFRHRPDGTIQSAENPPKKYQDIYPLDFECEAWQSLWDALLDVALFWCRQGVRVFRVDNPHTKPFAFWEWFLAEVRLRYPETRFLSEAFARPEIMHRLTMVGFTLSYSYFPWRQSKAELIEYYTELSSPPGVDEFRPSAWPNTPDILTFQLQGAPRPLFALRAFLAATLTPSWGIYGPAFELCDNLAAGNGKEEYGASEKYEIRSWDRNDPTSLRELIGELNRIRYDQLALRTLRTLRFHPTDNDALLACSKTAHSGPSTDPAQPHRATVLVVANLDPHWTQGGWIDLDLAALGVDGSRPFTVHDLLADRTFTWEGPRAFVELHPDEQPGHIFRITQG